MNSIVNRSTGKAPFDIVYVKCPNFTTDISLLNVFKSKQAVETAEDIVKMLVDVKEHATSNNK